MKKQTKRARSKTVKRKIITKQPATTTATTTPTATEGKASKKNTVIALLRREEGATLNELVRNLVINDRLPRCLNSVKDGVRTCW